MKKIIYNMGSIISINQSQKQKTNLKITIINTKRTKTINRVGIKLPHGLDLCSNLIKTSESHKIFL